MVGVVIPANAMWAERLSGKVEQLSADLDCSQIEKVPYIPDFNLRQGSMESHQAVLKDVVGLHPAAQARMTVKHLAGELEEPVTGMV